MVGVEICLFKSCVCIKLSFFLSIHRSIHPHHRTSAQRGEKSHRLLHLFFLFYFIIPLMVKGTSLRVCSDSLFKMKSD